MESSKASAYRSDVTCTEHLNDFYHPWVEEAKFTSLAEDSVCMEQTKLQEQLEATTAAPQIRTCPLIRYQTTRRVSSDCSGLLSVE
jgi:hypothetical protein